MRLLAIRIAWPSWVERSGLTLLAVVSFELGLSTKNIYTVCIHYPAATTFGWARPEFEGVPEAKKKENMKGNAAGGAAQNKRKIANTHLGAIGAEVEVLLQRHQGVRLAVGLARRGAEA